MNNNKIVSRKTTTNAFFLAIVLITGTISLSFPPFMTTGANAQVQPYYDGMDRYDDRKSYDKRSYGNHNGYYESQYQSYKPDYKPKYPSYDGKDDRRDKSKDSSKSVSLNKIKCINTNLNINGNNAGNLSIGNKGGLTEEGYLGAYTSTGGGYGETNNGYDKKNIGFDCTINNNNNNIAGGGNQTIPPEPPKTQLNVTKLVTCQQTDGSGLVPSIQQISADCVDLLALITEDQFNITVTDTNVSPSNFNGSEIGTLVSLDTGPFTVTEEPYDSVAEEVAGLEDVQTKITGPSPSFSGYCTQTGIGSFSATGEIAAGGQETCNIVNNFNIIRTPPFTGSSSITTQGTADSPELTASEKIAQLKQQWLDLLP